MSPLDWVLKTLCHGRHYSWVGIYLAVTDRSSRKLLGSGSDVHPGQTSLPETRSKILVSMKIAGKEVGILDVESDQENAFGIEDRVLLEAVADTLARYLGGPGRYLVRHARTKAQTS
jgi:hypothetical protein